MIFSYSNLLLNFHWLSFRLFSLVMFLAIIIDFEMFLLIQALVFLHIKLGLSTIINDYIHTTKSKLLLFVFLRVTIIELGRCTLELLL